MKRISLILVAAAVGVAGMTIEPAWSANVKITPLGSHDGEFCRRDRAMLFEDPDGTRIVFDVGRTVAGPGDPRLGKIDVVLLSSVHGDHLGDRRIAKVNAGTCAKPKTKVKMAPSSPKLSPIFSSPTMGRRVRRPPVRVRKTLMLSMHTSANSGRAINDLTSAKVPRDGANVWSSAAS